MCKISPSILAADVLNMEKDIERIVNCGVDYLHMDIMDGHFVPNISFGPAFVKACYKKFDIKLDTHLMLSEPEKYIDVFAEAGSDIITIHAEVDNFASTIQYIKSKGIKAGASIKPNTPAEVILPYLNELDLVLIMTVEPGFGGQKFMQSCVSKARELRDHGYKGIISVDGGVNKDTVKLCTDAGADMVVMGTALFGAEDPMKLVDYVHSL